MRNRALLWPAQRKRRHTYPELLRARRCRLVVFGIETGGRWSEEAATFLRLLAQARAAGAPVAVRRAAQAAWVYRWSGILSVAAQRAFVASLLELPAATELGAVFFFSAHFLRQVEARSQCNCKLQYPARARPKSELAGGWKPVHPAITRLARPRAQPARRQQRRLCQEGARATSWCCW
eukprot:s6628_g3.t1